MASPDLYCAVIVYGLCHYLVSFVLPYESKLNRFKNALHHLHIYLNFICSFLYEKKILKRLIEYTNKMKIQISLNFQEKMVKTPQFQKCS